ncbi:hypothetical protein [Ulvibacterium marinum]|uniref:hypothetical protein n=1 Tax=Ulvibacterium marinum TaxID=2419782 RepID=UPI002494D533|nr:hypothetical protein [Ulvibacterium marinum]
MIIDCLEREPNRLRDTSLFYPQDSQAPEKLEALVKQAPISLRPDFMNSVEKKVILIVLTIKESWRYGKRRIN